MRTKLLFIMLFGALACFGQRFHPIHSPNDYLTQDEPFWLLVAQSAYEDYVNYCNEEVLDTITQEGKVTIQLIAIYNDEGVLLKYMYSMDRDTVWEEPRTDAYKNDYEAWDRFYNSGSITLGNSTWSTSNIYLGKSYDIKEDIGSEITLGLVQKYVYILKREKPSQRGFFNYIYQLIIEL